MGTLQFLELFIISLFPLRSVPESLERSQFQWSGAECFWQSWEHCNFSSYSLFPLSAPLRARIIHSSNGAERNAFDSDGNIAISLAIQYFPAPLRSVPIIHSLTEQSGMLLTVMGTLIFLAIQYFPAPLRSAPCQNHCYVHSSNGAERNAFDNVTLMMDKAPEHLFFHLRSVPLRVPFNSPEHWNMFPAFLLFPFPVPLLLLQFLIKIIFLTFFIIPPVFVMLKL